MPWNAGQGKFIRANPDFSGETVWQQDQQDDGVCFLIS